MSKKRFKVTSKCIAGVAVWAFGCLSAFGSFESMLQDSYSAFHYPVTLDKSYVESRMENFLSCDSRDSRDVTLDFMRTPFLDASCFSVLEGVQRVGVFDVGSTGIRLLAADVDLSSGEVKPLCSFEYSLPFGLSEADSQQRLAAIAAMKEIVQEQYCMPQGIEFRAVATAGFRAAGDLGIALAREIEHRTGVSFDVIDQQREGVLAFLGANLEYPYADVSNVVVWDIGGGSMQITTMGADGELVMAGCEIAAHTFFMEALARVKGGSSATPNPMAADEVAASLNLAKDLLYGAAEDASLKPFDVDQFHYIEHRIQTQDYVLGIGGVHARLVLPTIRAITGEDISSYTPELLWETIQYIVECRLNNDDIRNLVDIAEGAVDSMVTSLVLVYATMELLNIHEVHVLDINNTKGLVAEYLRK